jgi:hypothetical protein
MCLSETCSIVRTGKNVSDKFNIQNDLKQGDALSPLLFNFALEYAIRRKTDLEWETSALDYAEEADIVKKT